MSYSLIEKRLTEGKTIILDGGIGGELQKIGAKMDKGLWCGRCSIDSPDELLKVHENYINAGISLNFNDNNKLSFETKKNYKTESTELYNISYQYRNDCITAGLVYRREFYEDNDVEPKDTLMFKITFVPFGEVKTPSFVNP